MLSILIHLEDGMNCVHIFFLCYFNIFSNIWIIILKVEVKSDFLSRLKIIPRTHYPHFACNIVIELRKYGQDFYLEIFYNDILKYNNTLEKFKTILNNTKYSNLYNYCGIPSYLNNTNNTTNQTMNNQTLKNESKIENS